MPLGRRRRTAPPPPEICDAIWQLAGLAGVGPRLGESALGLMPGYPWTSPYEDMTLKDA